MTDAEQHQPAGIAIGTLLDGKFRVIRCLGRGGMGAVYEVRHELTQHRRALKLLHPNVSRDRDAVERFLKEASAAGRIDDPHITDTFDAGWLSSGEPYVLMELLEGETLDERLHRNGRLPLKEALIIISQAAHALHAAHEVGIIHRDLKPENVFLTFDAAHELFVKILDFGVSKFDDGQVTNRVTREGAFMGTPAYMSPEQFLDGKRVDGRTDVYALGVILFECATGQHPYRCETFAELAHKIVVEQTPPPSSLLSTLPPQLDTIVSRAMAKALDVRYLTAKAFALAIDGLRTGAGLTLPQGSTWRSEYPPPASFAQTVLSDEEQPPAVDTQRSVLSPLHELEAEDTMAADEDVEQVEDAAPAPRVDPVPTVAPRRPDAQPVRGSMIWFATALAIVVGGVAALVWSSSEESSPPEPRSETTTTSTTPPTASAPDATTTATATARPSSDVPDVMTTSPPPPPRTVVTPPRPSPSPTSDIAGEEEFR